MKIAVGIISLVLMVVLAIQSFLVAVAGSVAHDSNMNGDGMTGILVALLYLIAGAFAFAKPMVSTIVFLVACAIGAFIGFAPYNVFGDLRMWSVIALILGVLAFFAWRSDRKKRHQLSGNV